MIIRRKKEKKSKLFCWNYSSLDGVEAKQDDAKCVTNQLEKSKPHFNSAFIIYFWSFVIKLRNQEM